MPMFRKKPVVIEAVEIKRENYDALLELFYASENPDNWPIFMAWENDPVYVEVRTLEGTMRGNAGDWLIRGVRNEIYPCKPDIFAATYEPTVSAHVNREISMDDETGAALDDIIGAAVRRLARTE